MPLAFLLQTPSDNAPILIEDSVNIDTAAVPAPGARVCDKQGIENLCAILLPEVLRSNPGATELTFLRDRPLRNEVTPGPLSSFESPIRIIRLIDSSVVK